MYWAFYSLDRKEQENTRLDSSNSAKRNLKISMFSLGSKEWERMCIKRGIAGWGAGDGISNQTKQKT